uniref:Neural cell adhesion molecule L1-like protein n=1 Tax=Takifugu rubripes TaxID=31033 RepID=A0A674NKQ4_TAKRU
MCEAKGNPEPEFRWTKNGQQFDPSLDPRLITEGNSGTFVIPNNGNLTEYQGIYRCFASNRLGTAISREIEFIVPNVPKFPKETIEPVVVEEGQPFILNCNPPDGIPPLQIYWMTLSLQHIEQDERVSMGLNGDLYFSHAVDKDSRRDYCCFAAFPRIRTIVQKTAMSVIVKTTNAILQRRPSIMTPPGVKSETQLVKGEELILECIAAGFPTPQVEWVKMGQHLPTKAKMESHGKLLIVPDVEQEDGGKYMCKAKNTVGEAVHYFTVIVEEPPEWVSEPESQLSMIGSDVLIKCSASGTPQPAVTWRVNGAPLQDSPSPNRRVLGDTIVLHNTKASDSAVYQCEASNRHGTLLSNANIMIMNLPPMILTQDDEDYSAVEGKGVMMHCKVFSSPPSAITWSKDDTSDSVEGPRFSVHDNGTLEIYSAEKEDSGPYTCFAKNTEGSSAINVMLSVKGSVFPSDCGCSQDDDFEILWEKDDKEIAFNYTENSRLDNQKFIIQYEESQWEPGNWKELLRVPGNHNSAILKLHGHVDYCFRVSGVNAVGRGPPSQPTERYRTPPAAPDKNPENIKIESHMPQEMNINWEPLLPIEHNGPGLEYKVSYRRQDVEEDWQEHIVKRHSFVVKNTPTFVPYEIKIQARNHQGWGPEPRIKTGYSGEDFPSAAPDDVAVEVINSSVVKVSWMRVHKDKLHGHLGGYRISWWRLRSLVDSKKNHGNKETLTFPGDRNHALVPELTPFSEYSLIVMTFNGRGNGPGSHPVNFKTPEGERNPAFRITDVQRHTVSVAWAPPLEPNGILTGYLLEYQLINDTEAGPVQTVDISNPSTTKWIFRDLEPVSKYQFDLRSCTTVGCGAIVSVECTTTLETNSFLNEHNILEASSECTGHLISSHRTNNDCILKISSQETAGSASIHEGISTQGWFIGLMCAVALLTLIVLIACFVNRNKGGKYSVKEKEDLHPDVESQGMNDDTFCEYSDNDEKPLKGSQRSLSREIKAADSGDSLVDYGDEDVQFNEDGSFIGEYAGRKEKRASSEIKATVQTPA